jgi:DNA-binding winged helix-turn-helix (wHTH) protein
MHLTSHDLSLDLASRRVHSADRVVRLEPKAFDLLLYMMRNPGRVVSKQELLDSLWWGEIVGESVLTRWVSCLRKVLADDARTPRFIRTVHRCGYEFIAPVEIHDEADGAPNANLGRGLGPGSRFIGRSAELHTLRAALSICDATRTNCWLVSGERGLGKTRLLYEAARAASGPFEVHSVGAGAAKAPLALFRACLRSLVRCRTMRAVAAAFRRASSQTRSWLFHAEHEQSSEQVGPAVGADLDELAAGLSELARARPLALVLDDLQASDVASLVLFERLVTREQAPIVVLGAFGYQQTADAVSGALASLKAVCRNQIVLRPFGERETAAFIEPWSSAKPVAQRVLTRTGGNPRFLSLLAQGSAEGLTGYRLPEAVRTEVHERLAALPLEAVASPRCRSKPWPFCRASAFRTSI